MDLALAVAQAEALVIDLAKALAVAICGRAKTGNSSSL